MSSDKSKHRPLWAKNWLRLSVYTIHEAALLVAGYDPDEYSGSINNAVLDDSCNKKEINTVFNKLSRSHYVIADEIRREHIISRIDLIQWSYENGYSFPDIESSTPTPSETVVENRMGNTNNERSLRHCQKIIKSLVKALYMYENNDQKPPGFTNRSIINSKGNMSYFALRELLQELDPETPRRAEETIKSIMNDEE